MAIQQTEEQRKKTFEVAGVNAPETTISSQELQTDETSLNIPEQAPPTDRRPTVDAGLQGLLDQFTATAPQEAEQTDLQQRILELTGDVGSQKQRQQELEAEAGLGEQRIELQGVINQLQGLSKEAQAIPLQIQQEFAGRGVTKAGVAPIQTARLRENAIKALGLSAIGQTLQGNISLAQTSIQQALDAEFEPQEAQLKQLGLLLTFNRDALERTDKKRTDQLNIVLGERDRLLKEAKADKEEIFNIGLIAQQNGAPTNIVQEAFQAETREEALNILGQFAQDPATKVQLQNALLDTQLKKISIQKKQEELALLRQFGGLTPLEHQKKLKAEQKERKEAGIALEQSVEDARQINQSITQIDAILNNSALDIVVGGSPFSRSLSRTEGILPNIIGFFGTAPTGFGVIDEITGKADDVVGLTEQIIDQQFLEKLIEVKSKGATFGALSDAEGNALRAAANAIASRKIKKGEKTIGYDMSEAEFKRQMKQVQELMRIAFTKASGESFSEDEQGILDELFVDTTFNPAF